MKTMSLIALLFVSAAAQAEGWCGPNGTSSEQVVCKIEVTNGRQTRLADETAVSVTSVTNLGVLKGGSIQAAVTADFRGATVTYQPNNQGRSYTRAIDYVEFFDACNVNTEVFAETFGNSRLSCRLVKTTTRD